ncbi:hypothetical protein FCI23_48740 [Actinacidiphila oryziradicis]|uniref:Uncharacterized protein n=1 Tax=Actinacidiphila oryziradicis TaxID=2571141 RepID=A0A4U0SD50_9ACTN|nr:hypothetical protein FCI23_48740 [Actinacidiphila oryziradicis]
MTACQAGGDLGVPTVRQPLRRRTLRQFLAEQRQQSAGQRLGRAEPGDRAEVRDPVPSPAQPRQQPGTGEGGLAAAGGTGQDDHRLPGGERLQPVDVRIIAVHMR